MHLIKPFFFISARDTEIKAMERWGEKKQTKLQQNKKQQEQNQNNSSHQLELDFYSY